MEDEEGGIMACSIVTEEVCPYNDFCLCYGKKCPAYQDIKNYNYFCKYVEDGIPPKK